MKIHLSDFIRFILKGLIYIACFSKKNTCNKQFVMNRLQGNLVECKVQSKFNLLTETICGFRKVMMDLLLENSQENQFYSHLSFQFIGQQLRGLGNELESYCYSQAEQAAMCIPTCFYETQENFTPFRHTQLIATVCLHFSHVSRQPPNQIWPMTLVS